MGNTPISSTVHVLLLHVKDTLFLPSVDRHSQSAAGPILQACVQYFAIGTHDYSVVGRKKNLGHKCSEFSSWKTQTCSLTRKNHMFVLMVPILL